MMTGLRRLPPELVLCVSDHLDRRGMTALSQTCSQYRSLLHHKTWHTVCIDWTSGSSNVEKSMELVDVNRIVSGNMLNYFIEDSKHYADHIEHLVLRIDDKMTSNLAIPLAKSLYKNLKVYELHATVTMDRTLDTVRCMVDYAGEGIKTRIELVILYDYCVPPKPLINSNTESVKIYSDNYNDLVGLLELSCYKRQLPPSLRHLELHNRRKKGGGGPPASALRRLNQIMADCTISLKNLILRF